MSVPSRTRVPRLLLVTDHSQLRLGRGLLRTVAECAEAGLTHVLVRELDLSPSCRAALVAELAALDGLTVWAAHTRLLGAAGVHLPAPAPAPAPASSPPAAPCNAGLSGPCTRPAAPSVPITPRYKGAGEEEQPIGIPWGRSCHTPAEVRRAAAEGAAWATLSPFAATASKPGYGPPVDRAAFGEQHGIPVLALGGIGLDNAREARSAGAHGVAVMGAVMRAPDPAAVVADLVARVARAGEGEQ